MLILHLFFVVATGNTCLHIMHTNDW